MGFVCRKELGQALKLKFDCLVLLHIAHPIPRNPGLRVCRTLAKVSWAEVKAKAPSSVLKPPVADQRERTRLQ